MADDEKGLKEVFSGFCSFGNKSNTSDMDNASFFKLVKGAKLIGKKLQRGDVDVAFAKVKDKGKRKINFKQFKKGLEELGKRAGGYDKVVAAVLKAGGPTAHGTQADAVRLHDDKSSYTGVYAAGGPSNVDKDKLTDLSQIADRNVAATSTGAIAHLVEKGSGHSKKKAPKKSESKTDVAAFDDLADAFLAFCRVGDKSNAGEMDNAKFFKLCKESKVIHGKVSRGDVDVAFSKVKPKGGRKIKFKAFEKALADLAVKRYPKLSADEAIAKTHKLIKSAGGPHISGTQADKVKFHDDKDQYVGVSKVGGPSNVDSDKVSLNKLLDRSPADARGVKK